MPDSPPRLPFRVAFGPTLRHLAEDEGLSQLVREALSAGLGGLVEALRIPSMVTVEVESGPGPEAVALAVGHRPGPDVSGPADHLASAWGAPPSPPTTGGTWMAWLAETARAEPGRAADFLAAAVVEAVRRSPWVLIRPLEARRWTGAGASGWDVEGVEGILQDLVELHVPLPSFREAARWRDECVPRWASPARIAEELAAAAPPRAPVLEMEPRLAARLLGEIPAGPTVPAGDGELPGLLEEIPRRLWEERGVRVPPIRVATATLPNGTFRLRLGAVAAAPRTAAPGSTPPESTEARNVAEGLYSELAAHAHRLLDLNAVDGLLGLVEDRSPALVRVALRRVAPEELVRVLRTLLRDGHSIRNLREILESLLLYDFVAAPSTAIVIDPRLVIDERLDPFSEARGVDYGVSFVRKGAGRLLVHEATGGAPGVLPVHLLEPAFEERVLKGLAAEDGALDAEPLTPRVRQRIRTAIREGTDSATGARGPLILTTAQVAAFLRRELQATEPRVWVLAYDELPSDVRLEPVARIGL